MTTARRRRLDVHWKDESYNFFDRSSSLFCWSALPAAISERPRRPRPIRRRVTFSQTDLTVGTGAEATAGKTASVQYNVWLYSETGVDKKGTQLPPGQFAYVVGSTSIIKGFDMGVTGMKVGGIRRIVVPPSLAYGATGSTDGTIKPNAALVFEISLANVQ